MRNKNIIHDTRSRLWLDANKNSKRVSKPWAEKSYGDCMVVVKGIVYYFFWNEKITAVSYYQETRTSQAIIYSPDISPTIICFAINSF